MFSPELMSFIIKYQDKESLYSDKKDETKSIKLENNNSYKYGKLAAVVIQSKR